MSNYKRATFEEEEGSDIPADGAISPDSVEVSQWSRVIASQDVPGVIVMCLRKTTSISVLFFETEDMLV